MTADETFPRVWVSFDFIGVSFDPDAITAQLGVEPTSRHRIGAPIFADQGRYRDDRWRVTIGPHVTVEIGSMFSELMDHMKPGETKLHQVCKQHSVEAAITCAIEPTSSVTPQILFPMDLVRWAAQYNVELAVDVMLWRTEDGETRTNDEEHG
jgi:hypothetical protein